LDLRLFKQQKNDKMVIEAIGKMMVTQQEIMGFNMHMLI